MAEENFHNTELPSVIPVFPLMGVILLPDAELPLHIFEPRYRKMVEDAFESHRTIGMIQPIHTMEGTTPKLYSIGCAGRIINMTPVEDGRYLITLKGIKKFSIQEELAVTTPYRQVVPGWASQKNIVPDNLFKKDLISQLVQFLATKDLTADFSALEKAPDSVFIDTLSMAIPFEPAEKQALLETESPWARAELFQSLLKMVNGGNVPHMPN